MNILSLLPAEIILIIINYLDWTSRKRFSITNKYYRNNFNPDFYSGKIENISLPKRLADIENVNTMIRCLPRKIRNRIFDFKENNDSWLKYSDRILPLKEFETILNTKFMCTDGDTYYVILQETHKRFTLKIMFHAEEHGKNNDIRMPCNVEWVILKKISWLVYEKVTNNILLPIAISRINVKELSSNYETISRGENHLSSFRSNNNTENISIHIFEYAETNLYQYILLNNKNITETEWIVILFQLIHTLAIIQQRYPSFRHNNFYPARIFIEKNKYEEKNYKYYLNNMEFSIPNIDLQIKITNFNFSWMESIENNFVNESWVKQLGISKIKNQYYDIHLFFNRLDMHYPHFKNNTYTSQNIIDFYHRVVPQEYRYGEPHAYSNLHRGRLLSQIEYITPYEILKSDPLFAPFRKFN